MKLPNEFPGLDENQLQMINDIFPTAARGNHPIYIEGGTNDGKTNVLNPSFELITKDGVKIIELGDKTENDRF